MGKDQKWCLAKEIAPYVSEYNCSCTTRRHMCPNILVLARHGTICVGTYLYWHDTAPYVSQHTCTCTTWFTFRNNAPELWWSPRCRCFHRSHKTRPARRRSTVWWSTPPTPGSVYHQWLAALGSCSSVGVRKQALIDSQIRGQGFGQGTGINGENVNAGNAGKGHN